MSKNILNSVKEKEEDTLRNLANSANFSVGRIIVTILSILVIAAVAISFYFYSLQDRPEPPAEEPAIHSINYELNGGINDTGNPATFTAGAQLVLKTPTKEGYIFDGWYTNLATATLFDGNTAGMTGPLTLYANWITSDFSFSGADIYISGGSFLAGNSICVIPEAYGGKKVTGIGDAAFMDNDTIIWMILSSNIKYIGRNAFRNCPNLRHIYIPEGVTSIGENAFKDYHADLTLYFAGNSAPQDAPIAGIHAEYNCDYRIDYKLNGGANNVNNPPAFSLTMLQQGLTLNDPTIEDNLKLFAGWYSDAGFNNKVTQLEAKNYTLYAKWEYKKFNLTLYGEDGTFTVNSKALAVGTPIAITYNDQVSVKAIANASYKFIGWYNDSGFVEQVSANDTFTFSMGVTDKVLYAKFEYDPKDNPITVSFPDSIVYGEFFNHNININNNMGGTPVITFKEQGADDETYTVVAPSIVGDYTLRIFAPAVFGYKEKTITQDFFITKATYNISGISFTDATYTYDGVQKELLIQGILPVGVEVSYTDNTRTNAGRNELATASFTGDAHNYNAIEDMTAALTIERRSVRVTIASQTITYGDEPDLTAAAYSVDDLVAGEGLNGELAIDWGDAAYGDAGEYEFMQGSIKNDINPNYNISFEPGATLTINKKDVTVKAVAEEKTYGIAPTLNYNVVGLLDESHKAGFTGSLALDTTEVAPYPVGDYDIVIGTLAHPNYNIATFEGAVFTVKINDNIFSVSITDYEYGTYAINTLPTIIFTNYNAGLSLLSYTFSEEIVQGEYTLLDSIPCQVGSYKVEVSCEGDSNYKEYTAEADFLITPADLTITYYGDNITYGGTPALVLHYSGWKFTDNLSNITPPEFKDVPTQAGGPYTITPSGGASRNYEFVCSAQGHLTIAKKALTVVANDQSITYGGTPDLTDYQVTGLLGDDELSGELEIEWGSAGENNVGEHTIKQGSLDNANYAISFTPGILTITEYTITVTANDQEITYGELPDLTDYSVSGLLGDDKVEGNLKIDWGEDDVPSVGTYTIEQGTVGNPNYTITFVEATLTVKQRDISGDDIAINLQYNSILYNGEVNLPSVTSVTVDLGEGVSFTLLTTDYDVSYSNDQATDVGTYTVTITASSDNCTGSNSINYTITPRPILEGDISVDDEDLVYNGNRQYPDIEVAIDRDELLLSLTLGTDYVKWYRNNRNASENAKVYVKGIGNYSGKVFTTFTIARLDIEDATITLQEANDDFNYIYDGAAKEPEVTGATIDGLAITFDNVSYDNNTNVGQATVTISGTGNFTGNASTTFEITPLSIEDNSALSISLPDEEDFDYVYNGEAKEPTPTVKLGETTLVLGTDYTVSYSNNTEIGTATVTIEGAGNYKDTADKDFEILLTVTFVANGGAWADDSIEQYHYVIKGQSTTAPEDPTNDTYEALLFTWDLNDYTNLTADLTVTAHWYTEGLIFTLIDSDTAYNVKAPYMASFPEVVFIPALYNGQPVTKIPEWAFAYADMVSIIFAENSQLTAIGTIDEYMGAFFYCEALENIVLPKTIELIGAFTFSGCDSLAAIHIEEGGSTFATIDGVLFNFDYTELLLYPIAKIGDSYEIPASVTTIGEQAFNSCKLQTVTFAADSNIETIDNTAFSQCVSLAYIELPVGLKTIGQNAFQYCPSLESIVIPNSVTTLGKGVFITGMKLTIYTQFNSKPSGWNDTWNSNNRPVVWGCTLDTDGKVLSFNKTTSNPSNTSGNTVYNPSFKDLIFEGWYTNADFSGMKYYNITSAPIGTLYAHWVESEDYIRNIIKFNANGGNAVDPIVEIAGTAITLPTPTRDGHDFDYWYVNDPEEAYTTDIMPDEDITLIAHWTIHTFDVTFVLEGKADIVREDVEWHTDATAPEWTKPNYTLKYNKSYSSVENDLIINCHWEFTGDVTELETLWSAMQDELFFNMWSDFFTDAKLDDDYQGLGIKALLINGILPQELLEGDPPQANYVLFALECAYGDITDSSTELNSTLDFNFSKLFATNIIITNAYAFDYIIQDISLSIKYSSYSFSYFTEDEDVLLRYTGKTATHFDIPNGVERINYGAFLGKTNLTTVTFPASLTLVDDYAFAGCASLQEVHLPDGCSIGYRAFYGCTDLEEVTVGGVPIAYSDDPYPAEGLYFDQGGGGGSTPFAIGAFAFTGCTKLTKAKIPFGTNIGQGAFDQGTDITMDDDQGGTLPTIYIDGILYQVDEEDNTILIKVLTTVAELTLPNSFTCVYSNAFGNVANLIPKQGFTFESWYKDADLSGAYYASIADALNDSYTDILYPNYYQTGLAFTAIEGGTAYSVEAGSGFTATNLIIPEIYKGKPVTTIADHGAFSYSSIEKVTIPASVTRIGMLAFNTCESLAEVNLSEGLISIEERAFVYCRNLGSIDIPDSVTSIGIHAFQNCSSLVSVNFGAGSQLLSIGEYACQSCSNLTTFTIPDSVITLGDGLFSGCNKMIYEDYNDLGLYYYSGNLLVKVDANIVTADLKPTTRWIVNNVFNNCSKLESITIGDTDENDFLKVVDNVLFSKDGSNLIVYPQAKTGASYTIPSSVITIRDYAFAKSSLTEINFEENSQLEHIGESAFANYSGTSIVLPNSVLALPKSAFTNCSNLETVVLLGDVEELGEMAFFNCGNLTNLIIYTTTPPTLDWGVFNGSQTNLTIYVPADSVEAYQTAWSTYASKIQAFPSIVTTDDGFTVDISTGTITGYSGSTAELGIPASVEACGLEFPITAIGDEAFISNYSLTKVTLPDSITSIGARAFIYCGKLKRITFSNNLISVGANAFFQCSLLDDVYIPASLTDINTLAFSYCGELASFTVDGDNPNYATDGNSLYNKDMTTLIQYAIGQQNDSFILPNSVTHIDRYAFNESYWLKTIICNEDSNLISIGDHAFAECRKLETINFPASLESIGTLAFDQCWSLVNITVADGNQHYFIDGGVLFEILGENQYRLIKCPVNIGEYIIPNGTIEIDAAAGAFADCTKLTSISIPEGITEIPAFCFAWCEKLAVVTLPSTLKSIGQNAFTECAFTSFIFPDGLESIGKYAFSWCQQLETAIIPASVVSIGEEVFASCNKLTIYTVVLEDSKPDDWHENWNVRKSNYDGEVTAWVPVVWGCEFAEEGYLVSFIKDGQTPEFAPERAGYTFEGWNTAEDFSGTAFATIAAATAASFIGRLYAKWEPLYTTEENDEGEIEYIYFGEYPQSLIEDGVTVDESEEDDRGYYLGSDGCYYAKVIATPYIDKQGNIAAFSTGDTVVEGDVYYFKVEPIKWRVLSIDDGKALILCESIIANRQFYKDQELREIDGETIYPNNYEYSDIRAWLNNEFYNTAFSALQHALIQITLVDNSEDSTSDGSGVYMYLCGPTDDKIFFLSINEIANEDYGFYWSNGNPHESRRKIPSDYSRATGAQMELTPAYSKGNGIWWLRSPSQVGVQNSYKARDIRPEGSSYHLQVDLSYGGVVPALVIDLS